MQEPERKLGGDRQSIWSIPKSEQATSSASPPQRIFFAGLAFLAYHENPGAENRGERNNHHRPHGRHRRGRRRIVAGDRRGRETGHGGSKIHRGKVPEPPQGKADKARGRGQEKIREEARAKGLALAQARAQTLALGHALADAEWGAWNERRLAAEAKGEPFDEPTPATLRKDRSLTMAQLRATGPYIWVTWLPRLLSGESSCEWAAWFKAQHEGSSWARAPSDFDQAGWLMDHTALLNEQREVWEKQGCSVLTEAQNSFTLRGSSASLAGKPDLVAQRRDGVTVIDAKSGRPSPHHAIQVMIYMYALPRALERYRGLALSGQVAYPDHVVDIPAAAVDEGFIRNLGGLIRRLAAETSARRVPSPMECRFCEITKADCPDRLEEVPAQEGVTDDF